ncbi:hypothetical protein [Acidovorax sp. BLS4]|uniref:hypothetical protein n=1 Tax=Acidovorax sp. BLS4 TaxID=3273430 RepID=UPI0029432589|nr:hypothetical protein [Paracidovorax avenae]WOI43801.1 hypothetical protein R1Z03_14775 [Paracidovorax avenae]
MQGTDKQVKWANDIREDKMATINPELDKMAVRLSSKPAELAKVGALRDALTGKPAAYWIENRDVFALELMRAVGREVLKG